MTEDKKKKIVRIFWWLVTVPLVLVAVLLALVWAFAEIPTIEELENPDSKLATQVIAQEGEILTTYHIENRTFVDYDELAPNLVQATVATEDVRFYQHSGIDLKSLGRVLFKTLLMNRSSQGGGSTITQQLAKTLYPRGEKTGKVKMVWIKLKEWITAVILRHPVRGRPVLRQEAHRAEDRRERRAGGDGQQADPVQSHPQSRQVPVPP